MDFPFGHHHHRRDEDEDDQNRRQHYPHPDPYSGPPDPNPFPPVHHVSHRYEPEPRPPYPPVHHVGHEVNRYEPGYDPPVQHVGHEVNRYDPGYGPPVHHVGHEVNQYEPGYGPPVHHVGHEVNRYEPGYGPPVQHVGHEVNRPEPEHGGHFPFSHHQQHHSGGGSGDLSRQRTVRVYPKADEGFSLTIRDGKVVLAPADHTDDMQHWIKDEKYSTRVKDEEGLPCFALVNKVTGQAIKHSIGATHPVRLIPYNLDYLDESILWTQSHDIGKGFRCIRMVNNIRLNFDAFHGDKNHGGVRDGTTIVLWEWLNGENQQWKITPY